MFVNFSGNLNKEALNKWFNYIKSICSKNKCEDCPFVGNQEVQTDIGTLSCETGKDKKPRSKDG